MAAEGGLGNATSSFICPFPLAYAYGSSHTTYWVYENCAVPCPSVTFTHDEWMLQLDLFMYVLICALIVTIIMLARMAGKYFIRTMFIAGFIVYSVVLLIFLGLNADNDVVCSGDAHYIKQAPFCVFQASVTIFSITWVQVWSVIMAYDSYLHINSKVTRVKMDELRRQYFVFGFSFSFLCAFIPLVAGNLGFDPKANIPMCLYLFSDNPVYFWTTLFTPFCILNFLCLIVTILCVIKIQRVLVMSRHSLISRAHIDSNDQDTPVSDGSEGRLSGSSASSLDRPGHRRKADFDYAPVIRHEGDVVEEEDDAEDRLYAGHLNSASSSPNDFDLYNNITNPLLAHNTSFGGISGNDDDDDDLEYDSDYIRNSEGSFHSADDESDRSFKDSRASGFNSNSDGTVQLYDMDNSISPGFLTNVTESSADAESWEAHLERNGQSIGNSDDVKTRDATISDTDSVSKRWIERYNSELWSKFVSLGAFGDWRLIGDDIVGTRGTKISKFEFLVRKTLKYNGRTILFLLTFCVTTLFVAPLLIYMNLLEYDTYDRSGEEFLDCLVVASLSCPVQTQEGVDACGLESCGAHQKLRPPAGMLTLIVIWIAGYGIIPGIVFGAYG
jgi:hypothetical protein